MLAIYHIGLRPVSWVFETDDCM